MPNLRWLRIAIIFTSAALLPSCAGGIAESEVAPVYYNLGNAYMELGEYEKASQAFMQAIALDDRFAKATFNLAKVYIEQKNYGEAVTLLEDFLKDDPENNIIRSTLAYAYLKMGEDDSAVDLYTRILSRDPLHLDSIYNLGIVYWEREELERALDYFSRAEEIAPDDVDILYNLGMLYRDLEDRELSAKYLTEYSEREPEDKEVLLILAGYYFDDELYAKALELYDAILAISESEGEVLFKKAYIFLTVIGDYDQGFVALEQAVNAGFADEEAYRELVDHPGLLQREKIEEYLIEKELLSVDAGLPADTELPADG